MTDFTSSRAFRVAGKRAFDSSGIRHSDVDHLMIYDAFAHLPLYGLEDLGFVGRGEAAAVISERNTAGMYGVFALQETVRQVRGTAPAQVKDVQVAVCHGVDGMFAASGTIVMADRQP